MKPSGMELDIAHELRQRRRHQRKRSSDEEPQYQDSRDDLLNRKRKYEKVVMGSSRTASGVVSRSISSGRDRDTDNGLSQSPSPSLTEVQSSSRLGHSNSSTRSLTKMFPVDDYLEDIIWRITPTAQVHHERLQAVDSMKRTLAPLGLTVEVYGSLTTGLSTPASDIDMVMKPVSVHPDEGSNDNGYRSSGRGNGRSNMIDMLCSATNTDYPTPMQKAKIASCIKLVGNTLRHRSRSFTRILTITRARVPIVKCETAGMSSPIKIDLSFDKSGVATSAFLCKAFEKRGNELARAVTTLVKLILASAELNDPSMGGLGSFPTAVMVLFFFETHVQKDIPSELSGSLGVLLASFLKFYGVDFDFVYEGIDYVHGKVFKKPPTNALFVTNPLLPGTNCASSASIFESRIKPLFARAADCLSHLLNTETQRGVVEGKLRNFFFIALAQKNEKKNASPRFHRDPSGIPHPTYKANVWDDNGLYCGAILER